MRTVERAAIMLVGHAIKTARTLKGLTQKDLAERVNASPISLQGYETGRVMACADLLDAIARATGAPRELFNPPDVIEVTPDERDLLFAYRRIASQPARADALRAVTAIEAAREIGTC